LTGIVAAEVEVSKSEQFVVPQGLPELPRFVWLKVGGVAGKDDFGTGVDHRLVVSAAALRLLQTTKPKALSVEPY
jgi:hypothetical protein